MIFNGVDAHRLESTRTNVQSYERHLHAFGAQFFQQRFVKMQPGSRGRYRARFFTINCLIKFAVCIFVRTVDVRRQWHVADAVEDIQYRTIIIKFDFKQCAVASGHCCVDTFVIAQQQLCARFWRFRSANMRKNAFVVEHTLNQHFNLAAAGFTPKQARRDHAGIIKNQKIAGVELIE